MKCTIDVAPKKNLKMLEKLQASWIVYHQYDLKKTGMKRPQEIPSPSFCICVIKLQYGKYETSSLLDVSITESKSYHASETWMARDNRSIKEENIKYVCIYLNWIERWYP